MFYNEKILEILNGLIQFTLFLTGKFNSNVEQIEGRTASWNGLCSTFKGPLYPKLHPLPPLPQQPLVVQGLLIIKANTGNSNMYFKNQND